MRTEVEFIVYRMDEIRKCQNWNSLNRTESHRIKSRLTQKAAQNQPRDNGDDNARGALNGSAIGVLENVPIEKKKNTTLYMRLTSTKIYLKQTFCDRRSED